MVRAIAKPDPDPTYLEFFGLVEPPFAALTEPSAQFHTEQYSLLMSHLTAAAENPDCLVAICGVDGAGKTSLLERCTNTLGAEACVVQIDSDCREEAQLYGSFLEQVGFGEIDASVAELRHISREFLLHCGTGGHSVLFIIDDAHLVHPVVLEQVRWLATIKVEGTRVLSCIIAGNPDIVRIVDSPAMSQLAFGNFVRFHLRAYSEEETAAYIRHRLALAGGGEAVQFSAGSHRLIHRYTGGTPALINFYCDALLTEAKARDSRVISRDLLLQVADDLQLVPHVVPQQNLHRRRTDPDPPKPLRAEADESTDESDAPTTEQTRARPVIAGQDTGLAESESAAADTQDEENRSAESSATDIGNLLERLTTLSEHVDSLRADRRQILARIEARERETDALRRQHRNQSDKVRRLTQALGASTAEVERLRRALRRSENTSEELADLLRAKQAEARAAQSEVDKASDSLERLAELESELDRLHEALATRTEEAERLQSELTGAGQTIERLEDAGRSERRQRREMEELEASAQDLRAELEMTLRDLRETREELSARETTIADQEERLRTLHSDCTSLRNRLCEQEAEIESLADRDARIGDLERDLETSWSEREVLRDRVTELETAAGSLTEKDALIGDLETTLATRDSELRDLMSEHAGLREAMETARREAACRLETMQEELAESRAKVASLEAQLEAPPVSERGAPRSGTRERTNGKEGSHDMPKDEPMLRIEILKDGKARQTLEIGTNQRRLMVGRADDNDLRLESSTVSRHHAMLIFNEGRARVEDLHSLNGTLVNSRKRTNCALKAGDTVGIGEFRLRISGSPPA